MTVRHLGLPSREDAAAFGAWATVMGPSDLTDQVRPVLAEVLASRLRRAIEENAHGRAAVGIGQVEIGVSGEADCEDVDGNRVSAIPADQCCYRIRASIAVDTPD